MLCVNPYRTGQEEFGCGTCLPCRFTRRRVWVGRLLLELQCHRHACFVTLTYKENPGALRKLDLQKYIRALRKRGLAVRYFGVGEFGSMRGRPHFHVALFGVRLQDSRARDCWPHGFVDVGELNAKSAHYIAKYCVKSYGQDEKPVVLRSQGLGGPFASKLLAALSGREVVDVPTGIRVNGRIVPIGRYIREATRILLGREKVTPREVRLVQQAEYASEDASVRERKRENAYRSALVRLEFMKSKEKL